MTTSTQRRALREAGPYYVTAHGAVPWERARTPYATRETEAAILNAVAQEPEAVAKAREKVMRLAVIAGKATRWDDSLTNLNVACVAYVKAIRDAKRKKKP